MYHWVIKMRRVLLCNLPNLESPHAWYGTLVTDLHSCVVVDGFDLL